MIFNQYLLTAVILICFVFPGSCFSEENYSIDGETVLMYKILDWWEACSSNRKQIFYMEPDKFENNESFEMRKKKALEQYKDCDRLKGKVLEYSIKGDVQVEYQKENKELHMIFDEEDIGSMLYLNSNIFNKSASRVFKCIRLYEKHFSPSEISNCGYLKIHNNTLIVMDISPDDAEKIKKNTSAIGVLIKGHIGGMEKSRIFFQDPGDNTEYPPASLSIYYVNNTNGYVNTDGVFMEYLLESKNSE